MPSGPLPRDKPRRADGLVRQRDREGVEESSRYLSRLGGEGRAVSERGHSGELQEIQSVRRGRRALLVQVRAPVNGGVRLLAG